MKFVYVLSAVVACVCARSLTRDEVIEREDRAVGMVATIALNIAKKFVVGILKNHYSDIDLPVKGRSMRVTVVSKENPAQVQMTDRGSGESAYGSGADLESAIAAAAETLIQQLLSKGIMSIHDLHLPPTPPAPKPTQCVDTWGDHCLDYVIMGYCTGNFREFMMMNCKSSCGECW